MHAASESESSEYRYPAPGMIGAQPTGDDQRFGEILRIAREEALRQWDDEAVADDISQVSAISIWRQGITPENLTHFIRHAVRRKALNVRRGHEREAEMLEEYAVHLAVHEPSASYGEAAPAPFSWKDRYADWVASLPPKRQQCFRMVREEGLSFFEAAGALGLSPRTVERHVTIAHQQAREFFERAPLRRIP